MAVDVRTGTVTSFHGSVRDATIVDVEWSIEVVISSLNDLDQIAVPVAVIGLRLSNHVILVYRLRPEELHQWRFTLAKCVRDLLYLEKKQPATLARRAGKK